MREKFCLFYPIRIRQGRTAVRRSNLNGKSILANQIDYGQGITILILWTN
jgi:hypothetical protein